MLPTTCITMNLYQIMSILWIIINSTSLESSVGNRNEFGRSSGSSGSSIEQDLVNCCTNSLTPSLFPNSIGPYLRFSSPYSSLSYQRDVSHNNDTKCNLKIIKTCKDLIKNLTWGRTSSTCKNQTIFLNSIFESSGLSLPINGMRTEKQWAGIWSKTSFYSDRNKKIGNNLGKSKDRLNLPYQKYNHVPFASLLGNKVKQLRLAREVVQQGGIKDFMLESYILPDELRVFRQIWEEQSDQANIWILKPAGSSMSKGVEIILNWTHLESRLEGSSPSSFIIQRYLTNPYLVHGKKVEITSIVLVTSTMPTRAYISYERNVRLGFTNFTLDESSFKDRCSHYHALHECGHVVEPKDFSLLSDIFFKQVLHQDEESRLKSRMEEIVRTMLLAAQPAWWRASQKLMYNRYNAFQLFSFDFFIDAELQAVYLNEINTSPRIWNWSIPYDCETAQDCKHKLLGDMTGMFVELFNIAGYQLPESIYSSNVPSEFRSNSNFWFTENLYTIGTLSKSELQKQEYFVQKFLSHEPDQDTVNLLDSMLVELTKDDVKLLALVQDELSRVGPFFKSVLPPARNSDPESLTNRLSLYAQILYDTHQTLYYHLLTEAWNYKYGTSVETKLIGVQELRNLLAQFKI